ncbi:unnamed protein product [Polarella glacialis]|uniref:Uncharacterized protein n=1 Tax=Polarella glacialis TaxID=89957 RepID=A0A813KYM5_POLGL|nr:unnamed protein product [Polarella glacialis]CAE8716483.1 unnamed protein product [Polarella glacialis]
MSLLVVRGCCCCLFCCYLKGGENHSIKNVRSVWEIFNSFTVRHSLSLLLLWLLLFVAVVLLLCCFCSVLFCLFCLLLFVVLFVLLLSHLGGFPIENGEGFVKSCVPPTRGNLDGVIVVCCCCCCLFSVTLCVWAGDCDSHSFGIQPTQLLDRNPVLATDARRKFIGPSHFLLLVRPL